MNEVKEKNIDELQSEKKSLMISSNNTEKDEIKTKSKKFIILIILLIIIAILLICSTIFAIINLSNTKIMKGIVIGNVDISNLTTEEATQILNEIYNNKNDTQIILNYNDFETTVTYETLEVKYQIENAIKKAYEIGRTGNIFIDNFQIINAMKNKVEIELEASVDNETVQQIIQNINNSIEGAVQQSSYYIENDKLIITSGKEGLKVDESQLIEKIYKCITTEDNQTIEIPLISAMPDNIDLEKIHEEVYKKVEDAYYTTDPFTIYPEVIGIDFDIESAKTILLEDKTEYEIPLIITEPQKTVKDLGTEAFPDKLATYSSKYDAKNTNRTTNLILATQKINGTVLLPGEEFSYNKIVGERTIEAGYKEASVYSNGQVVNGLGGGICQISSTLYNAVIMANLEVTDRRNHQFVAPYVPAGQDATVVYGSQDFKFKNTRNYPIRIEGTVSGGIATITIWGIKEEQEYEVSIQTKKIATIPYTIQYIEDSSLPTGQKVVMQSGSNGQKVEAYKVVKQNGQIISTTLLSKDTYNPMKRIVKVGTGQ